MAMAYGQLKTRAMMAKTQAAAVKLIQGQDFNLVSKLISEVTGFEALLPNGWQGMTVLSQAAVDDARNALGGQAAPSYQQPPTQSPTHDEATSAMAGFLASDPGDQAMVSAKKLLIAAYGEPVARTVWKQARQRVVFAALQVAGDMA